MKVHTFNSLRNAGIKLTDMRNAAADDWQSFRDDVAYEEGTKAPKVTAKTIHHHDFAAFAMFEDGELSDIVYAVVEDDRGNFSTMPAHHAMPDFE